MDLSFDFSLVRSQKLLLIPQLKQAIDLLEMNSMEIFRYVQNQMEANPALEEAIDDTAAEVLEAEGIETKIIQESPDDDSDIQSVFEPSDTITLKEHLIMQLNSIYKNKLDIMVGEYLIDSIDDNGFLAAGIEEAAAFFKIPEQHVLDVLAMLQLLDPPGICARNLRECLLLQLKQQAEIDNDAILVVERYLDEIASNDAEAVSVSSGLSINRVRDIFGKVKSLEPRPGREFYENTLINPAIPDIIIKESSNGFSVLYNEDAFPDVLISVDFAGKASELYKTGNESYMHENLESAIWMIKCLEQRKDIIFATAQKICDLEQGFLKYGPERLQMINRTSFAASLDMHESILEKVLYGKYLQCKWGVFEFCDFFSGCYQNVEETFMV